MSPFQFFYAHASYSRNPEEESDEEARRRTAEELVRGEAYTQQNQLTYQWFEDDEGETLGLIRGDVILAAIGGITNRTPDTDREFQAILSWEYLHNVIE